MSRCCQAVPRRTWPGWRSGLHRGQGLRYGAALLRRATRGLRCAALRGPPLLPASESCSPCPPLTAPRPCSVDLLMHGYQYNITGDREVEEARSTPAGSKAAEQPPSRIEAAAALLRDLPGITPEGAIQVRARRRQRFTAPARVRQQQQQRSIGEAGGNASYCLPAGCACLSAAKSVRQQHRAGVGRLHAAAWGPAPGCRPQEPAPAAVARSCPAPLRPRLCLPAPQNPKNLWDECLEANRRIARPSPPLVCDQAVLDKWELRAMIEKRRAREALAEGGWNGAGWGGVWRGEAGRLRVAGQHGGLLGLLAPYHCTPGSVEDQVVGGSRAVRIAGQASPAHSLHQRPSRCPPRPGPRLTDWERRRSEIGMYPTVSADWRSDVRCRDPGNPTSMGYREWTHQEIWDLITLGGKAADPRAVRVSVEDPLAPGGACRAGAAGRWEWHVVMHACMRRRACGAYGGGGGG